MTNRFVTLPMTARDLDRWRSWTQYVWDPLCRKWLEIQTRLQYSIYMKWHLGIKLSRDRWRHVTLQVKVLIQIYLVVNISKTVEDEDLVPVGHQQEIAYCKSNGHLIDDVMWPCKIKFVTPICWGPLSQLWLHVTLKVKVIQIYSDRNILKSVSLEIALARLRVL